MKREMEREMERGREGEKDKERVMIEGLASRHINGLSCQECQLLFLTPDAIDTLAL